MEANKECICSGKKVKRLAPPDQFLACTLEGGFGWEQICPFLDKDIPKTPYPRGNAPAEFQALVSNVLGPRIRNSMLKALGTILVPTIGIGMWAYTKRR